MLLHCHRDNDVNENKKEEEEKDKKEEDNKEEEGKKAHRCDYVTTVRRKKFQLFLLLILLVQIKYLAKSIYIFQLCGKVGIFFVQKT